MHTQKMLIYIVDFVMTAAVGMLGIRFLLKLFAANPGAPFVEWMYAVTAPLLAPFRGIFPSTSLEDGFIVEFATLFAMAMYALLQYLVLQLIEYTDASKRHAT